MATIKKASVKAIEYCSQLTGKTLGKSTTWEECADILLEGFEYDVQTHTKSQGDNTIVNLYRVSEEKGKKDIVLKTWSIPNSEVFYEKDRDWDWAYLYKMLSEFIIKNRKNILAGKPIKDEPVIPMSDPKELQADIQRLKEDIKKSTGKEKKRLIQEYNTKSLAAKRSTYTPVQTSMKLDIKRLREIKNSLYHKVRNARNSGKDITELEKQLAEVNKQIADMKK